MSNRRKYVFNTLFVIVVVLILAVSFLILRDYSNGIFNKNETKTNNKTDLKENNNIDNEVISQELTKESENKEEVDKEIIPSTGNSTSVNPNTDNKNSSNNTSTNTNPNSNTNSNQITVPQDDDSNSSSSPSPSYSVVESYSGKITGYGPDCYGCTSMRTASGMYVGEGNVYYQDNTFGKVRIVAADKRYPFGTIVRISNLSIYNGPILAVVLDRGGSIGDYKYAQFDLLFEKERDATVLGLVTANFEILRLGY